jgi:argininosuccinate lyase
MNQHAEVTIRERVKLPPAATMIESYYGPALDFALRHTFRHELWVHVAHVLMLEAQGIIAKTDREAICRVLLDLEAKGPGALKPDGSLEDLYSYLERHVTSTLGPEVGGRMHTGRSRNDLHVTVWRMALRTTVVDVLDKLLTLRQVLIDLADRHVLTVMPGYTHWQHAQPVSLGYYYVAFADALERDFERLVAAYGRTNHSPLGAGALTTTSFPIDRTATAQSLGFDGLVEVAYDAVSSRDDAHETAAALAILATNLSRLAVDLQAWTTMEYAFMELGDQHSAVSSIMPQKKNPSCLEHMKTVAAKVTGALTATLSVTKNTAFADVSDGVTGVNEPVIDAAVMTGRVLAVTADVLKAVTVFPDRMRRFAEIGFGTATELADVIVRQTGLSFRMAHNIVAVVVADAIKAGKTADQITAEDLVAAGASLFGRTLVLDREAIAAALDPEENLRRRTIVGGPAPSTMAAMLAERRVHLGNDAIATMERAEALRARRAELFRRAAV